MRKRYSQKFSPNRMTHIFQRDEMTCVYCGKPGTLIDHVFPWSLGGRSITANGVVSCRRCNALKGGDNWINFVDKAFKHLALKGEDLSWVDEYLGGINADK